MKWSITRGIWRIAGCAAVHAQPEADRDIQFPCPEITPIVRIPANGVEMNQSYAKQALDRGVYGVVWPHINNAEQAYNAVASCRYARKPTAEMYEPAGARGDGPATASRYWGLTMPEYYRKADVWPLNPEGELLVFTMIESVAGVHNIDDILRMSQVSVAY